MCWRWSQTTSISDSKMIFALTFVKVWLILIQKSMYFQWIKREESPEYKFFDNMGELSIRAIWYHSNDTKRNLWVMLSSHWPINDSCDCLHTTVYLAVMLQASGILQRVSQSQVLCQAMMDCKTSKHQLHGTKRNPWVMLCSHWPINDSCDYLHTTVYLAVMLQASWHIAEGK